MTMNYSKIRAAQLQSWLDNIKQDRSCRIPLDQLRGVLTKAQMDEMHRRYRELRKERDELEKSYPDLDADAAVYWARAQKAFELMSQAKSAATKKAANKVGNEAMELWEELEPRDQVFFYEFDISDPQTGKAGIDNLEQSLPRLKNLAHDRQELQDVEGYVQWEALTDALERLQPTPQPEDNPATILRLHREKSSWLWD